MSKQYKRKKRDRTVYHELRKMRRKGSNLATTLITQGKDIINARLSEDDFLELVGVNSNSFEKTK